MATRVRQKLHVQVALNKFIVNLFRKDTALLKRMHANCVRQDPALSTAHRKVSPSRNRAFYDILLSTRKE